MPTTFSPYPHEHIFASINAAAAAVARERGRRASARGGFSCVC